MTSIQVLERKMNQHMKDNADHIKHFTNELQILKAKVQRPSTALARTKNVPRVKRMTDLARSPISTPVSAKATVQHRGNDEHETAKRKIDNRALLSSAATQFSEAETDATAIDFDGNPTAIKCSPLNVLQFLVLDLQDKLKNFVPDDDEDVSRRLKDINFAIKQAHFNSKVNEVLSSHPTMKSQATQAEIETKQKVIKRTQQQQVAKAAQTSVFGDDVDKMKKVHDKFVQSQQELVVDLRNVEGALKLELSKSEDKIVGLKSEISLLQQKLECERNEKASIIDEIRGEVKFLMGAIGETRNQSLIDTVHKKLARTNKKLDDVKRKCLEATKQCLKIQLQNLVAMPTTLKENDVGLELGVIKSDLFREIATLKSAFPDFDEKRHRRHVSSLASSPSTSTSSRVREVPSESIKSPSKWIEKKAEISFDDKYSSVIGDGKKSKGERSSRRAKKQEINTSSRRTNASSDANDSVGSISGLKTDHRND